MTIHPLFYSDQEAVGWEKKKNPEEIRNAENCNEIK